MPTPAKKSGSDFSKKIGPLTAAQWGVGLLLAIGVGLYIRHRSAQAATSASPATSATDPGAAQTGGASSTGTGSGQLDAQSAEDLASALNGFSLILGGGTGFGSGSTTGFGDSSSAASSPTTATAPTAPGVLDTTSPIVGFTSAGWPIYQFPSSIVPSDIQPDPAPVVAPASGAPPPTIVPPPDSRTPVQDLPGVGQTIPYLKQAPPSDQTTKPTPGKAVAA